MSLRDSFHQLSAKLRNKFIEKCPTCQMLNCPIRDKYIGGCKYHTTIQKRWARKKIPVGNIYHQVKK